VLVLVAVFGMPVLAEFIWGQAADTLLVHAGGWLIALLMTAAVLGASLWLGAHGLNRIDL
jgi:biotin transporter BioY